MKSKLTRLITLFILIIGLSACGGSGGSGGSGSSILPKEVAFIPPTQNSDGSPLADLTHYRLYYGPDVNSLNPVFLIDTQGSTITSHIFSSAQKDILENLVSSNSTHFFALTAVNSQNIESGFSNIVEFL